MNRQSDNMSSALEPNIAQRTTQSVGARPAQGRRAKATRHPLQQLKLIAVLHPVTSKSKAGIAGIETDWKKNGKEKQ
jgi:hypothetical protein